MYTWEEIDENFSKIEADNPLEINLHIYERHYRKETPEEHNYRNMFTNYYHDKDFNEIHYIWASKEHEHHYINNDGSQFTLHLLLKYGREKARAILIKASLWDLLHSRLSTNCRCLETKRIFIDIDEAVDNFHFFKWFHASTRALPDYIYPYDHCEPKNLIEALTIIINNLRINFNEWQPEATKFIYDKE